MIQITAGCELHSGEAIESSMRGALGGLDVLRIQNHSCAPAPDSGSRGQNFCAHMTQFQGISDNIERLLSETCPDICWVSSMQGRQNCRGKVSLMLSLRFSFFSSHNFL